MRFVLIRSGEGLEDFLAGRFREVLRNVLRDGFHTQVEQATALREKYVSGLKSSLLDVLEQHLAAKLGQIVPEITALDLTPLVPDLDATIASADIRVTDVARTGLAEKGTGIRGGLLVAMLRYLTEHSRRSLIFAVEEPESFLHPEAQIELRRDLEAVAERPDATLLVTTHSPFILSPSEDARVFRLGERDDGGTLLLAEASDDEPRADVIAGLFGGSSIPRLLDEAAIVDGAAAAW